MANYKLLFLTERSTLHQSWAQKVAPAGVELIFASHSDSGGLLDLIGDCDFLISERAGRIDAHLLSAAPKLRLIQRLGTRTHDIDLDAARQSGIPVCTLPLEECILVAEHMLLQILALLKRLSEVSYEALYGPGDGEEWATSQRSDENTFAYNWSKRRGLRSLYGKNVGILGFGEIGSELAQRLRAMHPAQILYHKRQSFPEVVEQELGICYAQPSQLYAQSDVVCSLLPYSPATKGLLNADCFAQMKRGALFVHCGSGGVIDEMALTEALGTGHLAGAALDTYEWEPIQVAHPLRLLARHPGQNILLTPHIANGSFDEGINYREADFANVLRWMQGEPLLYRVV